MTVDTFRQDLRHALRLMRRDRVFTATALATLALGIGLNTAIFSVAYGVLWRPLPYPDPDRLIVIASAQQTDTGVRTFSTWAPVSYEALRSRVSSLEHLAAYASTDAQLTGRGDPLQVSTLEVSPNFFTTLGIQAAQGRTFLTGTAASDDDRSIVISDRLWRASLGADPDIVGQSIGIDGVPYTVAGVLPADFSFRPTVPRLGSLPPADVFLSSRWPGDTGRRAFLWLIGRMTPDATVAGTEAELTSLVNAPSVVPVGALAPAGAVAPTGRMLAHVTGLQDYGAESARTLLLVLLGAVFFVLLIACLNVANLQMARLTARRGELSLRMALGAGRRRIVRQLLTEAMVLSSLGAVLGVLLAAIAIDVTLPLVPQPLLPRLGGIAIDARVLMFCLALSIVAAVVVGLVPTLGLGGSAFSEDQALHAGSSRTAGDQLGARLRTLLVAAQIAMTLVLLVGAGLLIHSFARLTGASSGFESSGRDGVVQTVRVTLPEYLYEGPDRIHAFARDVLDRVQHLPGVTSASLINSAPFGLFFIQDVFAIEGRPSPTLFVGTPKIEAGYFETMGIPLVAGRDFTERDSAAAPLVAIVSERVVREYGTGGPRDILGQRVRLGEDGEWLQVVGVVADVRQRGLDLEVQPMIYVPFQQDRSGFLRILSFVARTADPARVALGIRAEIRRAAPGLPIESTVTMDEAIAASVAQPRFQMLLVSLFAVAATLVATCGIYGLMAYAVTERRREIGVRMALGATRRDVLRLVLTHAIRIIVVGLVAGLAGAVGVTRVLQRFLYGVTPTDPIVFTTVTLLLLVVGLLAAWVPARRATKVDPWTALRTG